MNGMIKDITFTNSRSFRDETIFSMEASASESKSNNLIYISDEESLLKVGVVYGPNASGKTNIIQFLYEIKQLIRGKYIAHDDLYYVYNPYWANTISQNSEGYFKIRFTINDTAYVYSLSFNKKMITNEYLGIGDEIVDDAEGDAIKLFSRRSEEEGLHTFEFNHNYFLDNIAVPDNVKPNQPVLNLFLTIQIEKLSSVATYLANINIANGYHEDMMKILWEEANRWLAGNENRIKKLANFLNHVDLGFEKFDLPKSEDGQKNFEDIKIHHRVYDDNHQLTQNDFLVPISTESFGSRRLFLLGAKILESLETGMPFIADELDASFHTFITSFIVNMFQDPRINSKNSQLIFTTHDISLMDEKLLRADQIWFTQKDREGASELYSLADFNDVEEDTPFSKWYMAKKFGAVPEIESLASLFEDETNE